MPPKVEELFGQDSDSDTEQQQPAARRPSVPTLLSAAGPRDSVPADVKEAADKLAAFVAQNGHKYEDLTRERNDRGSPLGFLWDRNSAAYHYYAQQLAHHESNLGKQHPPAQQQPPSTGSHNSSIVGRAASGGVKRSRWSEGASAAGPPAGQQHAGSSQPGPRGSGGVRGSSTSSSGAGGGSTLAAMDAYMKRLAEKEHQGPDPDSDEERRRKADPLLKETSFDRRKVVAVYTPDGRRGHHMQDYIPPEEMAKFLEACGDKQAAARAAAQAGGGLGADNIGHKLLQKMGWKEGEGLGGQKHGTTKPIAAQGTAGGSGLGLGAAAHGAVEDGDDEYTRYRKRMQLGYKHRPNPLGNPRKQYY